MLIQIILGSTRPNRVSKKVGTWVLEKAKKRKDAEFEVLDLRDYPLPFFNEPESPADLKGNYSSKEAKKWVEKISKGDGYILVTPEYNHGYSAVIKNALDYAYFEWNKKAVAFVSYGGSAGGARAVEQLRQVAVELQMAPVRDGVHIVRIYKLENDKGNYDLKEYEVALEKLFNQLFWWTKVLKTAREVELSY